MGQCGTAWDSVRSVWDGVGHCQSSKQLCGVCRATHPAAGLWFGERGYTGGVWTDAGGEDTGSGWAGSVRMPAREQSSAPQKNLGTARTGIRDSHCQARAPCSSSAAPGRVSRCGESAVTGHWAFSLCGKERDRSDQKTAGGPVMGTEPQEGVPPPRPHPRSCRTGPSREMPGGETDPQPWKLVQPAAS